MVETTSRVRAQASKWRVDPDLHRTYVERKTDNPAVIAGAIDWLRTVRLPQVEDEEVIYRAAHDLQLNRISRDRSRDLILEHLIPRCKSQIIDDNRFEATIDEAEIMVENSILDSMDASVPVNTPISELPSYKFFMKGTSLLPLHEPPRFAGGFRRLVDFVSEYEALDYAIGPVVRTASVYTLTAATGAGKTAWMVMAALAIATGRGELIGCPDEVERGRVAYLCFENPDDIRMRFLIACHRLGLDPDSVGDNLLILDQRTKPEAIGAAMAELAGLSDSSGFKAVFVDTLAAFFDGDDSNSSVLGGEFMRRLRAYTLLPGRPAVVVAAHPVKNATEDNLKPYGTGAVLNEVDGNLTLWRVPGSQTVRLHWQGKLRGPEFDPMLFTVDVSTSPAIVDRKGRPIRLPTLMPATPAELMDQTAAHHDLSKLILAAVQASPGLLPKELRASMLADKATAAAVTSTSERTFFRKVERLRADGFLKARAKMLTLAPRDAEALSATSPNPNKSH